MTDTSYPPIPGILTAALDESSDQRQEKIFVAAGFVGREQYWAEAEGAWTKRLGEDGIGYYKTTEWRHLRGEFTRFRFPTGFPRPKEREAADKVRADLEKIVLSSHLIGFALGIVMEDYRAVLKTVPDARRFYEDDPTVIAFYSLMHQINRIVRRKAKGLSVAFIYDQSSSSQKVAHAFYALKSTHPIASRSMISFAPLDDKQYPQLQFADLLADVTRDMFSRWLSEGRPRHVPITKEWAQHIDFTGKFDREYMLHQIKKNLASKRFANGELPVRRMGRRQSRRAKRSV